MSPFLLLPFLLLLRDLIAFNQANDKARLAALDQLTALDQELGLGY
jgi:hypothetical protein